MRKRREFIRKSANRDARLIIIATEDTKATPKYFQSLCSANYYHSPKVHVRVLEPKNTSSDPKHVLKRLKKYQREYELGDGDELWLVSDVDQWELKTATKEAKEAGCLLAISNPSTERYDKSNLAVADFLPHIENAIQRAEQLDTNPQDRWPQGLGTHVYRLVKSILDK